MLEAGVNDLAPIKPKVTTHQIVATDLAECASILKQVGLLLQTWKEDYTQQSQPPARGAPLGEQRFEFWFL
jgi:hypothetical protein